MQLSYNIFLNFQPVFQRDHHNKLLQSLLLPCRNLAVMEITIKQIDAKSLAKTIMDSYHKFFKTRKIKKLEFQLVLNGKQLSHFACLGLLLHCQSECADLHV